MVPHCKVTSKVLAPFIGLLLLALLPSSNGSNILSYINLMGSPAASVAGNTILSYISLKGSSSGSVADSVLVKVNADAQARLEVEGNVYSGVKVNGGSLKFLNNVNSAATLKDCNLEVTNCVSADISGQKNKGIIKDFDNSDFTGNDNELDIAHCDNCRLQSEKMTIVSQYSEDLRVQDSSHSKVKMLRVDSVQVSGRDFTLEGTDIQDHAFIGKGCSNGEKITHRLTFLPSAKRPCPNGDKYEFCWINSSGNAFVKIDRKKKNYPTIPKFCVLNVVDNAFVDLGIEKESYPTILKSCDKTWPLSLHFCNAAKVIGPTYEIGGLPRLTIEIEEEKAYIKVINGNPECKIVSEDGRMKVSISASSEELMIEGAKDIRRKEDGKCEFILSLGKDDSPGQRDWFFRRWGL